MKDSTPLHQTEARYAVEGLTCGHCASAVTDELMALDAVQNVEVEVVAGAASTIAVSSQRDLGDAEVAHAVAQAGDYRLIHRR